MAMGVQKEVCVKRVERSGREYDRGLRMEIGSEEVDRRRKICKQR